jgi:glycosyltransferase involved in cell wall biosynthesis
MKTVVFTITNDVFADQRVNKMAKTVAAMGFRVILIGVKRKNSPVFTPPYAKVIRLHVLWQKGPLFYAGFNLQLFFFLLFSRFSILVANDLDTLLPAHLVARLRGKYLVYDTHEYFTGTPEICSRPRVYKTWKWLENKLFPKQKTIITVNDSIARLYSQEYGKEIHVVRNVPPYRKPIPQKSLTELKISWSEAGNKANIADGQYTDMPATAKRIIILQGTGINIDRGAEELIEAMRPEYGIHNAVVLIIGGGNAIDTIQQSAANLGLHDRVLFLPRMAYDELFDYTIHATIGVSLDKDHGLNYRFSLPNKLFDYIMAGTPVLASDLPEVARIVDHYQVGRKIQSHDPAHIAQCISEMLADQKQLDIWRKNCLLAARELCWENEIETINKIYAPLL